MRLNTYEAGPFLTQFRCSLGLTDSDEKFEKARFVIFDNFLSLPLLDNLRKFTLSRERLFVRSGVVNQNGPIISDKYRRSRVLYNLEFLRPSLLEQLIKILPNVLLKLYIPPFPIAAIDMQVTATNHNEFFRRHIDNGLYPYIERRTISFTCFFHIEQAAFEGGQLCLYDFSKSQHTQFQKMNEIASVRINPECNRIIFFPSHVPHEIMTVYCPSKRFSDSRFTLNGWIYRA